MNKELIIKLIERAKTFSENAYCPYTNVPVGCALMTSGEDDPVVFGGCNIENGILSNSVEAGEVAVYTAISQGHTKFLAICFWSQDKLLFPSGKVRQLLSEFNLDVNIVVANSRTYSMQKLRDIYPFAPENDALD